MSEYINKSDLYKEIAKLEKLARDRYLDTPIESPVFVRYQSQLNERTNLKHLIADFPAVEFDRLRELTQTDKKGRCLMLPAGFEFENGIYVLCGDISKVKEDKKGYSIKSEKAYFLIKNEEKYIFVSVANMSESLLKYYETQIGMINAKKEETK